MQLSSVMRAHVVTVSCDATAVTVADVFAVYQQPSVPVVDDADRMVGAISPGALLRRLASLKAGGISAVVAFDLADVEAPTACSDDDALAVATRILDGCHDAVVVLEGGKVVGLVGVPEACRALAHALTEANPVAG